MKVFKAEVLGFCMGVKRAVESAETALAENESYNPSLKKVFTLGPLIHNPTVLDSLSSRGVEILTEDNYTKADASSVVIIRAHGTTPQVMDGLKATGATIIDSTCPRVHLSQKRAREWVEKGYTIIIAGDRNHGEVTSISGYAEGNVVILQNANEAKDLDVPEKSVLLSQTTFSSAEFEKIQNILSEKNSQIVVFNSICPATFERQNALKDIEGKADGIIVVGGKTSANTRRLFEIAKGICPNACHIENATEIPEFFYSLGTVALTAGASTPDSIIDEVEKKLLNFKKV